MPEYVLKILFRFEEIDDAEARADMRDILARLDPDSHPCEYTLRALARRHGGKTGKVIDSGVFPEEK